MKRPKINLPWPVVSRLIDIWIHNGHARDILKKKMHNEEITFEHLAEEHHESVQNLKNTYYQNKRILYSHIPTKYIA